MYAYQKSKSLGRGFLSEFLLGPTAMAEVIDVPFFCLTQASRKPLWAALQRKVSRLWPVGKRQRLELDHARHTLMGDSIRLIHRSDSGGHFLAGGDKLRKTILSFQPIVHWLRMRSNNALHRTPPARLPVRCGRLCLQVSPVSYGVRPRYERQGIGEMEQGSASFQEQPCSVCGGTKFSWGYLTGRNDLWFREGQHTESGFSALFTQGYERCQARKCTTCGNVLLFAQSR